MLGDGEEEGREGLGVVINAMMVSVVLMFFSVEGSVPLNFWEDG